MTPAARLSVFDALVRDFPDAKIAAISRAALIVPMPPEVPVNGHAVIEGPTSMLDVVDPSQAKVVIDTWDRMLDEGGATASVRALDDHKRVMALHFVDLIDRYGIVAGVLIGYEPGGPLAEPTRHLPRSAVMRKDQLSVITDVDEAAVAMLGWSAAQLIGRRTLDLVHPEDHEFAIESWLRMLSRVGTTTRVRLRHQHSDGSWRWLEVTNHNNLAEKPSHVRADVVDVTAEVEAIRALRTNEQMLRRLAEALPVGVLYLEPDGKISYGNAQLGALVGVAPADRIEDQFSHLVPADQGRVRSAIEAASTQGVDADLEVSFQLPGGSPRRCLLSLRPVTDGANTVAGTITCLVDITDDANRREDLEHRVRHDPLTACLNHASILAELQRLLDQPLPDTWTVAVFIDLDEFKEVNDRYGHVDGDRLLAHVAAQLRLAAGEDGLVGRVGGDEFLMVVRTPANPRALTSLAGRVAVTLDVPINVRGASITPKASIGVAYAGGPGPGVADAAELVAAADAAMYDSKRLGDGTPIIARRGGPDVYCGRIPRQSTVD
jgi:diguanylate cyclase (GGDEF)-like protein/PAS domain S-box-containing protein